jgi:PIN domain nuclease of toxin-antitoxin system
VQPKFLLDTHIAVRWLAEPNKLSHQQKRILEQTVNRNEQVAISAITLLEIAVLLRHRGTRLDVSAQDLLGQLEISPGFRVLPLTFEIAVEVAAIGTSLRDPADRAIVATARVHRLALLTSDQRVIDAKLVSIID